MWRSKRNKLMKRIRAGEFGCVYCAGADVGIQPDHVPSRSYFVGRRRPHDLVVPSCPACNQGSGALDSIVAYVISGGQGNVDRTNEAEYFLQHFALYSAMQNNYPEIADAVTVHVAKNISGVSVPFNALGDFYMRKALELFGAKVVMALNWWYTGQPLPRSAMIQVALIPNVLYGDLAELVGHLPATGTLVQGKEEVSDQFTYQMLGNDDKVRSTTLLTLRNQVHVLANVEIEGNVLSNSELRPSCLKGGYPYGWPRLSPDQLATRKKKASAALAQVWASSPLLPDIRFSNEQRMRFDAIIEQIRQNR